MLKRIFIVALCLCLLVALVACKKGDDKGETELPVEENGTQNETTDADTADENAGTDQNGSGTSDNSPYYNPDPGEVLLPWVP